MTNDKSPPHGEAVPSTLAVIFGCEDHSCKEQKADSGKGIALLSQEGVFANFETSSVL